MKRIQSTLTIIVFLQAFMVILLGTLAVFTYRDQAASTQLRDDVAALRSEWGQDEERDLAERLAALELRAGMRDPAADQAAAALQQELAQASALRERFNELRQQGTANPDAKVSMPPSPVADRDPSTTENDVPSPPSTSAGPPSTANLSPTEKALAQLPVVATITSFDPDWNFYTIDKGQLQGIGESQEFSVREKDGYRLLATVKVSRVHPSDAIVEIVKGSQEDGAPTPSTGDFLIDTSQLP